jgi:hypothetical protein
MGGISQSLMNTTFAKANQGTDQLACIWSHLPDEAFPEQIERVDSLAHQAGLLYPNVKFKYCTAVEAYQLWRKSQDTIKPEITFSSTPVADRTKFSVTSNETIFQAQPFIAVKDIYNRYFIAECVNTGNNSWETSQTFLTSELVKAGVVLTDTMGNQSMDFINFLPDDKFIDNHDSQYSEIYGNWNTSSSAAWDIDSRTTSLNPGDSAKVRWNFYPEMSTYYSTFIQFPDITNRLDTLKVQIYKNGFPLKDFSYLNNSPQKQWSYFTTEMLESGSVYSFEITGVNRSNSVKTMTADVMKFTACVPERQLVSSVDLLNMQEHNIEDTLFMQIPIFNGGIHDLTIQSVGSTEGSVISTSGYPKTVGGMTSTSIPLFFLPTELGMFTDTVVIISDDAVSPVLKIPFSVTIVPYFEIVDNDDPTGYSEIGSWSKSVAQAYGNSSRFASLPGSVIPVAKFQTVLHKSGFYDVFFIVPVTVNAADRALYKVKAGGVVIDSLIIDQNTGSGLWKKIGRYNFNEGETVSVEVIDSRTGTSGRVLRADAVKWAIADPSSIEGNKMEELPKSCALFQNYPNPFNPTTVIRFQLPTAGFVHGVVYDMLGSKVKTLINGDMVAGDHSVLFTADNLPSGVYIFRLESNNFSSVIKMILTK